MTTKKMTAEEEHAFYADPANQVPTGLPVRRRSRLSDPVPVRFPETLSARLPPWCSATPQTFRPRTSLRARRLFATTCGIAPSPT